MIVFKEWLAPKAVIHEHRQTCRSTDKFPSRDELKMSTFAPNAEDSTKLKNVECPFNEGQHLIWSCVGIER